MDDRRDPLSNQPDTYDTIPDANQDTDDELRNNVFNVLANAGVDFDRLQYDIEHGTVFLRGVIGDEQQRAIIERQIRALPGIRNVSVAPDIAGAISQDELIIADNPGTAAAAREGRLSRNGPWKADPGLDEADTDTDVVGRTLMPGTTDSPSMTDVMDEHRSEPTDLEDVNPNVIAVYDSDPDTLGGYASHQGEDISTLKLDPDYTEDIGTTDVRVSVQEGEVYYPPTDPVIVSMTDTPSRYDEVGGVAPVTDTPAQMLGNDDDIAQRVRYELRRNAITTDLNIRVICRQGVVTLRGRVNSLEDAEEAEAIAAEVEGVIEVREELEIVT